MPHARVTSKGQITIPKPVREQLDLREGDTVIFLLQENGAMVRPVRRRSQRELHGALPATRPYPGRKEVREATKRARARRHDGERQG